jgi:hypothetical protein
VIEEKKMEKKEWKLAEAKGFNVVRPEHNVGFI